MTSSPTAVTATRPADTATRPADTRWRHFLRHAAEMALSMVVGMMLLGPIWELVRQWSGRSAPGPELNALATAVDMSAAMIVWMLYRGHRPALAVEMAAATSGPYLLLIVPFRWGVLSGEQLIMGGHGLMLTAMVIVMLARRRMYSGPPGLRAGGPALIEGLGRRWPTWIALAVTVDNWRQPSVPTPWALLVLPAGYLLIGGLTRRLRERRMLGLQLLGLALYAGLVIVALNAAAGPAAWLVAAGWGFHALWDLAHHHADAVVPREYAEWCAVVDGVIAVTIVLLLTTG
jgi:hypothetical protein